LPGMSLVPGVESDGKSDRIRRRNSELGQSAFSSSFFRYGSRNTRCPNLFSNSGEPSALRWSVLGGTEAEAKEWEASCSRGGTRLCGGLSTGGFPRSVSSSQSSSLLVQDDTQEGIVDVNRAVVLDEAQFSELVHEKIDSRACCTDHLRQHLLRYLGKHSLRLVRRAITC
jgi:hypothetical protein